VEARGKRPLIEGPCHQDPRYCKQNPHPEKTGPFPPLSPAVRSVERVDASALVGGVLLFWVRVFATAITEADQSEQPASQTRCARGFYVRLYIARCPRQKVAGRAPLDRLWVSTSWEGGMRNTARMQSCEGAPEGAPIARILGSDREVTRPVNRPPTAALPLTAESPPLLLPQARRRWPPDLSGRNLRIPAPDISIHFRVPTRSRFLQKTSSTRGIGIRREGAYTSDPRAHAERENACALVKPFFETKLCRQHNCATNLST